MSIKLNKTQINVLAQEIYSELEKEANKYKETSEYINFEDSLKNDEVYKKLKKLNKTLNELSEDKTISDYVDSWKVRYCLNSFKSYVKDKRDEFFKTPSLPSKTSIENKIILKTIDSPNVDELIASVKESFKLV